MALKEIRQIEPMIMKAIREAIPLNEVFALMDQHGTNLMSNRSRIRDEKLKCH